MQASLPSILHRPPLKVKWACIITGKLKEWERSTMIAAKKDAESSKSKLMATLFSLLQLPIASVLVQS